MKPRKINKKRKCQQTKKIIYNTEQEAEDALWLIKFHQLAWEKQQRVYNCEFCGLFHITSQQYDPERRRVIK